MTSTTIHRILKFEIGIPHQVAQVHLGMEVAVLPGCADFMFKESLYE